MNLRVASLFSGIGGIDLGFMQAGFEIVWANEFDQYACKTYRHNFGDTALVESDIKDINPNDIPEFDVLVAGFPCQPFSIAGKKKGFQDARGNLFFEIIRILKAKMPPVVFLENVSNLVEHDNGKTFMTIHNSLVELGYYIRYAVLDAKEYGNVPQTRKRVFIVAFLDLDKCQKFKYPKPIERTISLNDIIKRSIKRLTMVSYKKLWKLLIDKDLKKCQLVQMAGLSPYIIKKLNRNENVTVETLAKICKALNCTFDDIMELVEE